MGLSSTAYLIIGIVAVIGLALLLRSGLRKPDSGKFPASGKSRPTAATRPVAAKNPYRATSIVAGRQACDAVMKLRGKRFLVAAREIPALPLPDCDQPRCTCKYAHHEDRREEGGGDRRGPPGLRSELHTHSGKTERREKRRGRRASDWE